MQESFSSIQPSINDLAINDAIQHTFANFYNGSYALQITGGCFAFVNFIDNQQLDETSFGELKNTLGAYRYSKIKFWNYWI